MENFSMKNLFFKFGAKAPQGDKMKTEIKTKTKTPRGKQPRHLTISRFLHFTFTLLLFAALFSCEKKESIPEPSLRRIISTAPSNTEIIAGLGLADRLIATDPYSKDIAGVPDGITRIDFFYPDAEAIIKLSPDIIITNEHNSTGSGSDPFKPLSDIGIPVLYIPTSVSIEGIYGDIRLIAETLDRKERGEKVITEMKARADEIAAIGKTITDRKKVYFEISPAPDPYTFGTGTYLNEMITIAGAQNIFGDQSGWLSPNAEAVLGRDPDVILTNVGFVENPVAEIKGRPGYSQITAIKNNAVYQIDANASSRPSQHIVIALRQIAKAIYPDKYK
jgi:iron complex transport system substrate-binding protein